MGSSGNPGRSQGRRGKWSTGRVPSDRVAWAEFSTGKLAVNKYPEYQDSEGPEETDDRVVDEAVGHSVSLLLTSRFDAKTIKFILTNLTGPELDAFERTFQHAIELARPSVEARDKLAKEAFDSGDDSYERVYRALPTFVVREG